MKLNNFELIEVLGDSAIDWKFRAEVDVIETRFMFFKKSTRREIFRKYGSSWYFSDTGKSTPNLQAENLVRAYEAKHGKDLENINV